VDRAQTPLTGHVLPPAHHEGAPPAGGPPLATGRMLQVSEPSMDGVRHCGSPSPRSGPHGGGPLPDLPGTRLPRSGPKEPAARAAAPRPAGVARSRGRLARPPWRGPAAPRRVTASLSRKIVRYVQEMLHAWAREIRERWCAETRRRRRIGKSNGIFAPVSVGAHRRSPTAWTLHRLGVPLPAPAGQRAGEVQSASPGCSGGAGLGTALGGRQGRADGIRACSGSARPSPMGRRHEALI